MPVELGPLFRLSGPSEADIDSFHNDGYIVYPDVLTDRARGNLIAEIMEYAPVRRYLDASEQNRGEPKSYFIRPWNERGLFSDRLIDDPFITSLLQSTIGDDYHFCHSALNIAPRGVHRGVLDAMMDRTVCCVNLPTKKSALPANGIGYAHLLKIEREV